MELGIATRQVDGIGRRSRRLVGKRREERQLGAAPHPAFENRGIEKGEGRVTRHRDVPPERREGLAPLPRRGERRKPRHRKKRRPHDTPPALSGGAGWKSLAR